MSRRRETIYPHYELPLCGAAVYHLISSAVNNSTRDAHGFTERYFRLKVALWAINGIGLGHTARVCALAEKFLLEGCDVRLIFEHEQQASVLGPLSALINVEFAGRPWNLQGCSVVERHANKIRKFLSDCTLVVADMASVAPAGPFLSLVNADAEIVFLLRWMSRSFLIDRVLKRWTEYNRGNVIVVLPETLFDLVLGAPSVHPLPRFWFSQGFVFRDYSKEIPERVFERDAPVRIAVTCGAGGTHSTRGTEQLRQVLLGIAEAKSKLAASVECHAWVGANAELELVARSCGLFDVVARLSSTERPDWSQYQVVVSRPSFNTTVELMQTDAAIITGPFESDGESTPEMLRWLSQFGVEILPEINELRVTQAVLNTIATGAPITRSIQEHRRMVFQNATNGVARHCLSLLG